MQKDIVEKILYNKFFERLRLIDIRLQRMERKDLIDVLMVVELLIATVIVTLFIFVFSTPTDFIGLLFITWLIIIFLLITVYWLVSSKKSRHF